MEKLEKVEAKEEDKIIEESSKYQTPTKNIQENQDSEMEDSSSSFTIQAWDANNEQNMEVDDMGQLSKLRSYSSKTQDKKTAALI